jgi:hypothetical protein
MSWMALMELLPIYMTCSVGGTDTVALRTVSFKFWFWTDVIEVLLLRELLRQSDISVEEHKTRKTDNIRILINHNRTMVQRKTSFKYISHVIHSTYDKMDSH